MDMNELSKTVRRRRGPQRAEALESALTTDAVIKLRLDHL